MRVNALREPGRLAQVEARVRLRSMHVGGMSPADGEPVKLVPHPRQV